MILNDPAIQQPVFDLTLLFTRGVNHLWTDQGPSQLGSCQMLACDRVRQPTMNHCWPASINKFWRRIV